MASPVKLYQREMHDNLGFFANWLPGDPIAIGDAGVLEAGRFRRVASLAELKIPFKVSRAGATQDVQYTSTHGTRLATSAGATAAVLAQAEITIEFSRAGAFVFHASGLRPHRIANRSEIAEKLVDAYAKKRWSEDWLLVEALHVAERATIVVSEDKSAQVVLMANLTGVAPVVSLVDPRIGLTVASTRGKVVHIVGASRVRPLYSCLRLKDPLLRAPSVQPVRGSLPDDASAGAAFSRPAIDDLLSS